MNMTRSTAQEVFRTADLSLCGALCVLGFVVESVDKVSPHRSVFVFNESDELKSTIDRYWRGELRVEPQAFFNQLKVLKARIYER
jgi:hypothetical protein